MAVSLKINDELRGNVQKIATLKNRSPHWIMCEAVRVYIERVKQQGAIPSIDLQAELNIPKDTREIVKESLIRIRDTAALILSTININISELDSRQMKNYDLESLKSIYERFNTCSERTKEINDALSFLSGLDKLATLESMMENENKKDISIKCPACCDDMPEGKMSCNCEGFDSWRERMLDEDHEQARKDGYA